MLAQITLLQAADTARVSSAPGDMSLLNALKDPKIQHIAIMQPVYNVRSEFEVYQGRPLAIKRNISVTGAAGLATILDFDFVASAVQLCPECTLTFTNITIANVRHGTGEAVDFVVGSKGSAVLFIDSNRLRLACAEAKDAAAVIEQEPRSEILPGAAKQQQLHIADGQFQSTVFPSSLHLMDVTMDVPHETVEGWQGGTGGYALGEVNVTRLCYHTIDAACLAKASPDSCVTDLMDERRAAAAATAGQPGGKSTIGVAIGVSVAAAVCIAAAAAGIVVCLRRRGARQLQLQQPDKLQPAGSRKTPYGDVEEQYEDGSEDDLADLAETGGVDVDALRMFDSFIEGCNFVRAPLGVRKGWDVSKVLTTPLIHPGDDKNIQLGDFLGAGSFGRVYKAKFAGRDVAVKIIEHNSEASEAVESEVSLMLKFNHPNVVRAFYSITYTQSFNVGGTSAAGIATTTATGSTTSNTVLREVSSGLGIHSSGGSSNHRLGIASGSSGGGRYALARSRGLIQQQQQLQLQPQEVVIGASSAIEGSANAAAAVSTPDARLPPRYKPSSGAVAAAAAVPAANLGSSSSSTAVTESAASVAGSNMASIRSQFGNSSAPTDTDTVSRVYSWMGGSNPLLPPPLGLQPLAPPAVPGKEKRAETWLVQEYCDLGTLGSIVSGWQACEECDDRMMQRLLLLKDAATGIKVLHSMNTVHGDLTARNVLVCSNKDAPYGMVAKLADLGLSRIIKSHSSHRTTNTVGTLSHAAPELLRYGHCSTSVDIYAFGVMMWELYTNKAAFNKLQYGQFYETVVLRNLRPILPPGMPADYSLLMQHCWASDPVQRPNVDRVLHCLGLMISERQERLSAPTAASQTQSAPLPQIVLAPRYSMDGPKHISTRDPRDLRDCPLAMPDGTVRHRSCPGSGSASGPLFGMTAAAAAAAVAAAAAKAAVGDDDEDDTAGCWAGPPSRFSWGDRGSIGCATPSVPLRPLRQYISDDYGAEVTKEESWFV